MLAYVVMALFVLLQLRYIALPIRLPKLLQRQGVMGNNPLVPPARLQVLTMCRLQFAFGACYCV